MEPKEKRVIYWHPAFYANIQIELKDEADKHKVYGYSCFYKADVVRADSISAKEVTITFVSERYPRKLIRHLRTVRQYEVEKVENGIYSVKGDVFSIQILITRELSEKENLWLKSLTNHLKEPENARKLMEDYQKNQDNDLYRSALEAIIHANERVFREVNDMSIDDIFMEIVQEKFDRKLKEETEKAVEKAVEKEREAAKKAVEKEREAVEKEMKIQAEEARLVERISLIKKKCAKNKPLAVIADELETESDEVLPIYSIITRNPGKTVEEICEMVI